MTRHPLDGDAIASDRHYERLHESAQIECDSCDNTDETSPICEGCDCCIDCCNCTDTDCDCDACIERREER